MSVQGKSKAEKVEDACDITSNAFDGLENGLEIGHDIVKAIPTDRKCTVNIRNKTSRYILCKPRLHVESGKCLEAVPSTIDASSPGKLLFAKIPNTARGAVGVFTYDLCDNSTEKFIDRMAVMYKVPFNLTLKDIAYAVGVVDESTECNKELFQKMSKTTDPLFSREKAKGPSITHRRNVVTIRATMSDYDKSVMKIEVSEK
ncbi:hypothetical protein WMY93_002663 [Mugilogobius chulae]|uniref:Uncharacterized protein n=1 Tax=Mugilogobius chulae TaxID=88201 RepID=A0AAW0Q4B1_9GOBI